MAIKYYTRFKARLALASCTLVLFGNCHFSTPRKFDYKKRNIQWPLGQGQNGPDFQCLLSADSRKVN